MSGIVIVGAGQAGAALAARLRTAGYAGPVRLIGEEPMPPYQRPPLSKAYLLGTMEIERLYLRSPSFWEEQDVTLKLGAPVTEIDRIAKTICVRGEWISYDQLALTTGSRPRRLPAEMGGALDGVYTIRTVADVDSIAPEFVSGRQLLIVGGGYIGLEAAAVGAKLGLTVTLLERAPRILQRVATPETSNYLRAVHSHHGVKILENTGLERLVGEGRVVAAVLSDGRTIPVDFAIVGVGAAPVTLLADQAGLDIDNGICTDEYGRTSDKSIWAAGDCASFPYGSTRIRLESVGNAIDQAEVVAENMLGADIAYEAKPWFWSDQYDVKLQIAGLNAGHDAVVTRVSGDDSISAWCYRCDRLLAVEAINDPRAYMIGKRLIELEQTISSDMVSDASRDIKSLLAHARSYTTSW